MGECAAKAPCARLSRIASRALVLAAVGTGLWLAGQTTASAQELAPPPTAVGRTSSDVGEVAAPGGLLVAPATLSVVRAGGQTGSGVVPAVAPDPPAAAPVALVAGAAAVSAAAPTVHSAVVPVADLANPIVQAAKPLLEVAAPLRTVAAPVVAAVGQAVSPVADAGVPLADALDLLVATVADARGPLLGTALIGDGERPDAVSHGSYDVAQSSAAGPAGAARVIAPTGDDVDPTADSDGAAGVPGPMRPSTPATGGPAPAAYTGSHSSDQSPADLSAALLAAFTATLVAAGDARAAAGNIAFDPSFSPD
jgi:hypothetical protein